ncbi:hypothetical protein [Bacillus testis]|nr:hypothetical protein [Bacillus testis]
MRSRGFYDNEKIQQDGCTGAVAILLKIHLNWQSGVSGQATVQTSV